MHFLIEEVYNHDGTVNAGYWSIKYNQPRMSDLKILKRRDFLLCWYIRMRELLQMEPILILQWVKEVMDHLTGSMQRIDTEQGKKLWIGDWKYFDVYKIGGDMITGFMVMLFEQLHF
jgi:hypothetical protein